MHENEALLYLSTCITYVSFLVLAQAGNALTLVFYFLVSSLLSSISRLHSEAQAKCNAAIRSMSQGGCHDIL